MAWLQCPVLCTAFQIKVHIFTVEVEEMGKGNKQKIIIISLSSTVFILLWPELQFIYTYDLGWHGGEWLL